ncbi:MAG: hypothetical protein BGO05_00300 [Rhizobiales bacterium 63-7]|uniref:hypothetical protein n=1 Tax=Rhizobium sp. YJ-22 TaxID=3037556 RepID=UPI00092AE934|nr:hypothetical protein [Rhizobium sp. YJ-22]MBN9030835.1 hypothetical protein [Hyphomicrobiales bacterium]MDG3578163.1 hypothetical protein [Rhizobium sp. YJ-22]OJU72195.1 MAG: hypothetical protein BGO05_00300 [Rhizobiales bacterium 63-7]
MKGFFRRFRDRQRRAAPAPPPRKRNSRAIQVMSPHTVDLPHPADRAREIRVPASINGVDLSSGRL